MKHLRWPVTATRAGMLAENITRAFWPAWSVVFVALAPLLFGWQDLVAQEWVWAWGAVALGAFAAAVIWGARRFDVPQEDAAVERVDAALPGRPIAAVADTQAIGSGDAASEAVWQAHVARMEARTRDAAAVAPDLRVSDRDPYGLRYIALLFFAVALLFGSIFRIGAVPTGTAPEALATGPVWEGWVEPPAYTGKPSIYLNDVPAGGLYVPEGSQVTLRIYGEVGALTVTETISGTPVDAAEDSAEAPTGQMQFTAMQDGNLTISGENGAEWGFVVVPDQPPLVEFTGPVEADAMGEMSQPFLAMDDYGVVSGTATIALDLAAVDRRHGLAVDPEGFEPVVIDLPMPFTGDRTDFEEFIIDDFSEHPLANLPVTMTLEVVDAAGQVATSPAEPMILPGRRFFQPFAKAIIEQRRDLMWSRENTRRISQIMKAISHRPEGLFSNEVTYLRMRAIMRRIDNFVDEEMPIEARDEFVQALWDLAIQLEDGTLADARERLRRAQERLAEAMRDGASDEEIAELMQELREATDQYLDLLAQEMEPEENQTDQADNGQQSQEFSQSQLDAIMDRIQELMEEGRMAEAQELMEEYNRLLENLRMTQSQGGGGEGRRTPEQQAMEDLAETLEDQEELSDDAFRELQEQSNPERRRRDELDQGQQGQQGQQQGQQQPGQQGQQGQQQGEGQEGQQGGQQNQDGQSGTGQNFGQDGQQGEQNDQGSGGQGTGEPNEGELAERQQALRNGLNRLRDALPSLEGDAGQIAENSLERAEGAMRRAEDALESGDLAGAIEEQAEALDALRNGLRNLDRAFAENQNQQEGQGQADGETAGRAQDNTDPLGRELGATGGTAGTGENLLQGEDGYRRAEELLDELRRRSADQARPEVEKNYLKRLLEQF